MKKIRVNKSARTNTSPLPGQYKNLKERYNDQKIILTADQIRVSLSSLFRINCTSRSKNVKTGAKRRINATPGQWNSLKSKAQMNKIKYVINMLALELDLDKYNQTR